MSCWQTMKLPHEKTDRIPSVWFYALSAMRREEAISWKKKPERCTHSNNWLGACEMECFMFVWNKLGAVALSCQLICVFFSLIALPCVARRQNMAIFRHTNNGGSILPRSLVTGNMFNDGNSQQSRHIGCSQWMLCVWRVFLQATHQLPNNSHGLVR